jgi:heme-degrading monooxygenase HmoA
MSEFIAMNRFKIVPGMESEFEEIWKTRNTYLEEVPGFVRFNLHKGPEEEDHVLYASHTLWESEEAFAAWTKSEAFRTLTLKALRSLRELVYENLGRNSRSIN